MHGMVIDACLSIDRVPMNRASFHVRGLYFGGVLLVSLDGGD